MALCNEKAKGCMKRLLLSRMRLLCNHGFYGLLLMHIKYALDEDIATACTDGYYITFNPSFLEELTDQELDFVMMHEILHVVLQHCIRGKESDNERFNIAADIVVNSNILLENNMDEKSITLQNYGVSMHKTPDGKEGHKYTVEEVYNMLPPIKNQSNNITKGTGSHKKFNSFWDDHSHWGKYSQDDILRDLWVKNFDETCETIKIRDKISGRGTLPLFAKRILEKLKNPQTDWRKILNEFIQQELNDYSFSPPDRRFYESPFFLPDFNEFGDSGEVSNILFMIDTSGSMSDKMITAAYSEIKGAIDQFEGKLNGWLGFFDAAIIKPKPFSSFDEFIVIKPAGGGGTDFGIIFQYVEKYMQDNPPVSIIILTDGQAPFPDESAANGIPVLWLLNDEKVTPPWGKIARIKV